ncbi:hypothetical protein DYB25_008573 [Aphanomyces astaci]|uniref:RGS domain-containing protein n=1 Tax=Aphanomyces astaci TaxID=112090 RepID=A0A397B0J2_APHAT|nr:hypothetical protein DYB36_009458 [Aphanomyces astaci]RHY24766.1 hypothetical protein DYB25_008573 [Aphanomyces astaci]RHY49590.1 hypothetical protein DYB34_009341 [Aphanomyces astaci]RHY58658.1 hypothetical protein DYB38_009167 [Aphanomyces astaci]RHY63899.1 hypothetical protein DYB30_010491 [Aphanomyces astaci]
MGSFPSTSQSSKRGGTSRDFVKKDDGDKITTLPTNQNQSRVGSVCYEHLKGIPLATLLESSVGCKHFTALCTKINRDDVVQLYLALQGIRDTPESPPTATTNHPPAVIETHLRRITSTSRLNNKTIANLRISLNALGQTKSMHDVQDMISEITATLTEQEYQFWLVSQEGRDFVGESARFEALLQDQIAMCYFHLFLVQEYSSENLEFIESVLQFESTWIHSDVETNYQQSNVTHAKRIVTLFIEENAPLQINVPSKIRIRLERKIMKDGEAPKDVFRLAKSEISTLIQRDSWPRFTKSSWWSTYLNYDMAKEKTDRPSFTTPLAKRQRIYIQFIGEDDLTSILSSDLGREHLRIFLALEMNTADGSAEFLVAIQQYRVSTSENDRSDLAQQIFDTHLADNAPAPALHVSPDIVDGAKTNLAGRHLEAVTIEFTKAGAATAAFLEVHVLPKFKMSGLYAKYRILSQQRLRVEDGHVGVTNRKSSLVC